MVESYFQDDTLFISIFNSNGKKTKEKMVVGNVITQFLGYILDLAQTQNNANWEAQSYDNTAALAKITVALTTFKADIQCQLNRN